MANPPAPPPPAPPGDSSPPERTPERVRLALAITRHGEAKRRLAAAEKALDATRDRVIDGRKEVAAADEAVEVAKAGAVEHAVDAVMAEAGGVAAPPRPPDVRQARAGAQAARDRLDELIEARSALEVVWDKARADLENAAADLRGSVRDVVRADPLTRRLATDHMIALRAVVDARRALDFLRATDALPKELELCTFEADWRDLPGDRPWKEALAILEKDADAPLPLPA
jgi:hypothetical protein